MGLLTLVPTYLLLPVSMADPTTSISSESASPTLHIESSVATTSSATVGRSQLQNSTRSTSTTTPGISATSSTTALHQLEVFIEQDMFDDGTLHARVPDHPVHFHEDSCVPFYEARAEVAIAQFEIAFAGGDKTR
ncbi:hypothetical protein QBC41DRAFT_347678 [Cercophora samala]|uniref:Uncharacterized protein n=1 Tax=Cercophora samala TaxID=330535 RepID=A0AA39ZBY1_9PEZI|nr:hypothetical protein QBC41DRAFT_347678 [Cercophora samala]